jgi:hypothetical protein
MADMRARQLMDTILAAVDACAAPPRKGEMQHHFVIPAHAGTQIVVLSG